MTTETKPLDETAVLMDVAAAGKRMALHAIKVRPGNEPVQVETTATVTAQGPVWGFSMARSGCVGVGYGASVAEAERLAVDMFDANNGAAEVASWDVSDLLEAAAKKHGHVYAHSDCTFNYCPNPEQCEPDQRCIIADAREVQA